ncbi:MAG: hypothetical protein CSA11_05345 [Chloroflexi bacterium]|nr:MAG: hypothetical protein CSB13_01175 [Chloroflexota bacterium]PIE81197.1 MAG: hypothetical protein CSA11_05345 [Chloroflexota bacterium]
MDIVVLIHSRLSQTVVLFFLFLGIWGVYRGIRQYRVNGSYMGALVIGQVLYIVQGTLGAILWATGYIGGVSRPEMHILYGSFALVFLPFVFLVWLKGDDSNQAQWVLAFTTLFLFGIAERAISTA